MIITIIGDTKKHDDSFLFEARNGKEKSGRMFHNFVLGTKRKGKINHQIYYWRGCVQTILESKR